MTDFTELQRETLARHLRKHTTGEVRFDATARRLYSTDASIYQVEPLGVVLPRSVEDVQAVVQIAAEMRVPLTARGGGTSLSGQSIGPGLIVDVSKYLNKVEAIDREARRARVQPGVVLDQLNCAAEPLGLQFGPDVATASRANLGGMIGNNSAGARSIVYGKTSDHVLGLDVVLADGRRAEFGPLTSDEWEQRARGRSPEAALYARVRDVVLANRDEIRRRFPRILRRVSGYNLDYLCSALGDRSSVIGHQDPPAAGRQPTADGRSPMAGLHQLIIGSEGTLGLVTGAELALVPRPRVRGLLVPQFASLGAAVDALAPCLEFGPSAVELMDHLLLQLSAGNLALRDAMKALAGTPQALLMVEFSGDETAEVEDRVERLSRRLQGVTGLTAVLPALDPALRDLLWNLRRAAMPLLYSMPGDAKPVTFVEDCAVDPKRLPEFVARFRDLLRSHGTDGAFYGHASVGCLHIRPVLNLKDPDDVARMRRIAGQVSDLVLDFGGSLSGEHGDGMARSEWNEKMFGPVVYQAFRHIKHIFDPQGILNPGKVVDAAPMTESLRYAPPYHPVEPPTFFDYSRQGGIVRAAELCNGNGACRKTQGGIMCPSYRATLDENDTTRGRANALRTALGHRLSAIGQKEEADATGSGRQPIADSRQPLGARWLYEVFDLCLMCKACKAECPSNVDAAKLKAEFLQAYYENRPRPLGHRLMANVHRLNRRGATVAPLINWLQRNRAVRWLMEKLAGIDRRRSLPPLYFDHFRRWFARHRPADEAGRHGKVLLLDDCFTTFSEPAIGRAAVQVLEKAGYEVELAALECCGRALISKGFLREAQDLVRRQVNGLRQRLANGTPLLGLEPSCLLTLADEWTELVPGPDTRAVADAARLADGWLASEVKAGRASLPLSPRTQECVLHGHCHQKALVGSGGSAALLRLVPGLQVDVLDAGCCGMAGSFGFEKEHYDLSVKIANLQLLPALASRPEALVVAPGTSCRHQVHDLASRRAWHPLEVLAEQLA
ncbi:MAG: FAD-binding protein [Planctomycetes bacterium]|nr:FAD-binding protein [Planctomycetota bacterium]